VWLRNLKDVVRGPATKPLLVVVATLVTYSALGQSPPIVGSAARFREIYACVEKNAPLFDDRISEASTVARALVASCQAATQEPRSSVTTVMQERDAIQDDAVMSVLKARAAHRTTASTPPRQE
jgi:hypothetical protein